MKTLTKEEFMEQYGSVEVEFCYHYKCTTSYSTELNDGNTLQIDTTYEYRDDIYPGMSGIVSSLDPKHAHIIDKSGNTILECNM